MVVIVAAATATLVLAMTLRSSTSNPWERVFSQTHGAHVNITVQAGTDLGPVFGLDGIEEIAEPYPTIWDQRLIHGLDKADMAVFGLPADPITIGQPQVTDGRWLQAGAGGEVVLDRSTARDLDFEVGDTIEFLTAHGKEPLTVVGLAVSGNWGAYPDW
ncbi:MAG: ABC transporter permease, partial [Thermomicrobiales bacterium]|nr:ABC transporter permease [Thermomicrobiales bacterium]